MSYRSLALLSAVIPLGLLAPSGCASTSSGGAVSEAAAGGPRTPADEPPAYPTLSEEEKAAGWQLLFDGQTTNGWRGIKREGFPEKGWRPHNGVLLHEKNEPGFKAGDIVTVEEFDNFELKLEFRLTPRGNSGIKYLVDESLKPDNKKEGISFEFQILDDELHPDAKKGKNGNRTCGSLYDLIPPASDKIVHAIGQWNAAHLIVDGNQIEHRLNGKTVLSFVRGSPELKALIADSKYKDLPTFGQNARGRILLQDHNDEIAFRNIKVRKLPARVVELKSPY
jgi:hypothetical protein